MVDIIQLLLCIYVVCMYTSQPKCYGVVLYTDDVQLLHRICFFYMTSIPK